MKDKLKSLLVGMIFIIIIALVFKGVYYLNTLPIFSEKNGNLSIQEYLLLVAIIGSVTYVIYLIGSLIREIF